MEKFYAEIVDHIKALVQSLLWAVITMMLPLVVSIHLNRVYGIFDSTLLFCLLYWWYMAVSGSDRVSAWLAVKLNIQTRGQVDLGGIVSKERISDGNRMVE